MKLVPCHGPDCTMRINPERNFKHKGYHYCWQCRNKHFREVRHTCGHLYIHERRNQSKSEWSEQEEKNCPRCRLLIRGGEAQAKAIERGLPALTGTQAQASWAYQIREAYAQRLEEEREEQLGRVRNDPMIQKSPRAKARALELIEDVYCKYSENLSQTNAKWWIENRAFLPVGDPFYGYYEDLRALFREEFPYPRPFPHYHFCPDCREDFVCEKADCALNTDFQRPVGYPLYCGCIGMNIQPRKEKP